MSNYLFTVHPGKRFPLLPSEEVTDFTSSLKSETKTLREMVTECLAAMKQVTEVLGSLAKRKQRLYEDERRLGEKLPKLLAENNANYCTPSYMEFVSSKASSTMPTTGFYVSNNDPDW